MSTQPTTLGPIRLASPLYLLRRAWRFNATLTLFVLVSAVMVLVGFVGLIIDSRTVLGAPTWAKTTKFALSFFIYGITFLWMLTFIKDRPRLVGFVGHAAGGILIFEMALIVFQAARGRAMHFNVSTPLDAALWSTMSATIILWWLITIVGAVVLAFQRLPERDLSHALKLGLGVAVIGLGLGFLMPGPNATQQAALGAGERLDLIGAHTVGGVDGGPGLPFLGWSTQHGDLRIPHFVGIHGAQVIPLLGLLLSKRRRWSLRAKVATVWTASFFYLGLVALVAFQALRDQPIIAPDTLQLGLLGGLVGVTALAVLGIWAAARRGPGINVSGSI